MKSTSLRNWASAILLAAAVACEGHHSTAPNAPVSPPAGYAGFDIGVYPGDAALTAWRYPASPYHWVGYYLTAPCHRDTTWMGRYSKATSLGWGTAVLYVGQQDWSQIPANIAVSRRAAASPNFAKSPAGSISEVVSCSASLLDSAQAAAEAADAVAKAAGEGVPSGSAIFLDVEYVTSTSQALMTYISAWFTGVLADGRFRPAIYCAKSNAAALYAATTAAYAAAGRHDAPSFWIASSVDFALTSEPTRVGLAYANVWQGQFDVSQTWGGINETIDVDVADSPSPSAP